MLFSKQACCRSSAAAFIYESRNKALQILLCSCLCYIPLPTLDHSVVPIHICEEGAICICFPGGNCRFMRTERAGHCVRIVIERGEVLQMSGVVPSDAFNAIEFQCSLVLPDAGQNNLSSPGTAVRYARELGRYDGLPLLPQVQSHNPAARAIPLVFASSISPMRFSLPGALQTACDNEIKSTYQPLLQAIAVFEYSCSQV